MKELKNDGRCRIVVFSSNSLDVYNAVSQETRARLKDNERSTCSIVSAMEVDTRFQARGYTW